MRIALLSIAAASAIVGCAHPRAACTVADVDTAGWVELAAHDGAFSLRLPAGARALPTSCIDSACGRFQVGTWVLAYDGGRNAGRGGRASPVLGGLEVRRCAVPAGDRRIDVLFARDTARVAYWAPIEGRDSSQAGRLVASAALPPSPGMGGVYLTMRSDDPRDRAVFVAALRTLRRGGATRRT